MKAPRGELNRIVRNQALNKLCFYIKIIAAILVILGIAFVLRLMKGN